MNARPTRAQRRAVRAVLYRSPRLRRLAADLESIQLLMNIDNPAQPDAGPAWVIEATGAPSSAVTEAIKRCRRIAAALRAMAGEIGDLTIPADDRLRLRSGLDEQAAAWTARADAWAAPLGTVDVKAALTAIADHERAAVRALRKVRRYLRPGNSLVEAAS